MKKIFRLLKQIWLLNFFRRVSIATKYYNKKYGQILQWGLVSNEDTNFTYHITPDNISYLAHTIAVVTNVPYVEILGYISEIQSDKTLIETIQDAIEHSTEKRYSDKDVRLGRRVGWYALARALKPSIIVETGVDKGLGSVVLCAALLKNREEGHHGRYFGTDINPKAGFFLTGKYKEVGEIIFGDSIQSLSKFTDSIDLFINDSDHSSDYEYQEYVTITPLIREKTIILGDNAHVTNKLSEFSLKNNRKFLFFQEKPLNHWYQGSGIGISYTS